MTDESSVTKKDEIIQLQARIAELMTREVTLSREILANMREEESALLTHDESALTQIMSKRDAPLQELMSVREDRIESVNDLAYAIFIAQAPNRKEKPPPMNGLQVNALVDVTAEQSCEVLVLRDELVALIEKMNLQNSSNIQLSHHHHEYAKALNAHLDTWGYSMTTAQKPAFVERRKSTGITVINRE